MVELVEFLAKSLVDHPEDVKVTEKTVNDTVIIELAVAEDDMGKVIGSIPILGTIRKPTFLVGFLMVSSTPTALCAAGIESRIDFFCLSAKRERQKLR